MAAAVERFFQGYVEAFNRSLGERVDSEGIRAHFSPCFVAAGPQGISCGQKDDSFNEMLEQGYAFYKGIGTRAMAVLGVAAIPIDDRHQMANVTYRVTYEKSAGEMLELDVSVTSMLAARDDAFEIFAFVAGDEMAHYRKHGLVPADTS